MDERLYRSRSDRTLAGVCGGVAAWLGLDPSLVRLAWVLLTIVSGGVFLVIYIVMAVVVPDAPPGWAPRGRRPEPGAGTTWAPGGAWGSGAAAPGMPPGTGTPGPTGPAPTNWPEGWDRTTDTSAARRGERAAIVIGIVLVAVGVWLLVRDYIPINWDLVWPIAVIALGGILIAGAARRR